MYLHKILLNIFLLMVLILTSLLLIDFPEGGLFLILTSFISIKLIFDANFKVSNPRVWFVFAINMYHLSICVLDYIGFRYVENVNEIIIINFICVFSFWCVSMFYKNDSLISLNSQIKFSDQFIKTMLIMLFILSLMIPISFLLSGAKIKADFDNKFEFLFPILNFAFAIYIIRYKPKIKSKIMLFMVLYTLVISLLLGERNVLLSTLIMLLFYASMMKSISNKKIIAYSLSIFLLIPVLGMFKNVFTTNVQLDDDSSMFISLLNGEFRSAGYNLNVILNDDSELLYGKTITGDVLRSFVPGFIYKFENAILWYNKKYHANILSQGRGYGFSLAAEGYVNFGYAGIFIWFIFVSSLILYIYDKSLYDEKWLVVYFLIVPTFIYSLRGDLSTILSPTLKQIILPFIIYYITDRFLVNATK
ncbi:TPA: O-antigen polymerase [Vibrio parahaemolyticus]|nr:O-antigen polymerase [Vibrio parahaemolyticus]